MEPWRQPHILTLSGRFFGCSRDDENPPRARTAGFLGLTSPAGPAELVLIEETKASSVQFHVQIARGKAVIATTRAIKDRLWQRIERDPAEQPAGVPTAVADGDVEWVKPGITARVRHLRGEAKLRYASVQDIREQE